MIAPVPFNPSLRGDKTESMTQREFEKEYADRIVKWVHDFEMGIITFWLDDEKNGEQIVFNDKTQPYVLRFVFR